MIRRPPRSTRTYTSFPTRRSSDLHQSVYGPLFQLQSLSFRPSLYCFFLTRHEPTCSTLDVLRHPSQKSGITMTSDNPVVTIRAENPPDQIGRASCRERVCQYV